jgi:hypothetical protein
MLVLPPSGFLECGLLADQAAFGKSWGKSGGRESNEASLPSFAGRGGACDMGKAGLSYRRCRPEGERSGRKMDAR